MCKKKESITSMLKGMQELFAPSGIRTIINMIEL